MTTFANHSRWIALSIALALSAICLLDTCSLRRGEPHKWGKKCGRVHLSAALHRASSAQMENHSFRSPPLFWPQNFFATAISGKS
jgi:hypothetical protein